MPTDFKKIQRILCTDCSPVCAKRSEEESEAGPIVQSTRNLISEKRERAAMETLRQRNKRFVDRRHREGAERNGFDSESVTPESTLRTNLHTALQEFVEHGKRRDRFEMALKMLDAVRADWKKKVAENG